MWVRSLGWEDPLEKGMTTHSSILAWRIPWTEEPGGLQSVGSQRVRHGRSKLARTQVNLFPGDDFGSAMVLPRQLSWLGSLISIRKS